MSANHDCGWSGPTETCATRWPAPWFPRASSFTSCAATGTSWTKSTAGTSRKERPRVAEAASELAPTQPFPRPRRAGWRVVAAKELADHLLSVRFLVLLVLVGLAAAGSVYAAAGGIRDVAPEASETPALFLRLFTFAPEDQRVPSFLSM